MWSWGLWVVKATWWKETDLSWCFGKSLHIVSGPLCMPWHLRVVRAKVFLIKLYSRKPNLKGPKGFQPGRMSMFGSLIKNGSSVPGQYGKTVCLPPTPHTPPGHKMHTTEQCSGYCLLRLLWRPDSPPDYRSFYWCLLVLTSLSLGELTIPSPYLKKKWASRFMRATSRSQCREV